MQSYYDRVRARLERDNSKGSLSYTTDDKASYPFWKTPTGKTSTVRFIAPPDDPNTPQITLPYVEKRDIKLVFKGLINSDYATNEDVEVKITSPETFYTDELHGKRMSCPIAAHIRPLWKGSEEERAIAKKYYRKQTWVYQGLVVNSAFTEEDPPENPIRKFVFGKKLQDQVMAGAMDPERENAPWDADLGSDFRITVGKAGVYNDYSQSSFSIRTRPLSKDEKAVIAKHGYHDLQKSLGTPPDSEALEMIYAMFLDSLAGRPFDNEKYGGKYKAWPVRQPQYQGQVNSPSNGSDTAEKTEQKMVPGGSAEQTLKTIKAKIMPAEEAAA